MTLPQFLTVVIFLFCNRFSLLVDSPQTPIPSAAAIRFVRYLERVQQAMTEAADNMGNNATVVRIDERRIKIVNISSNEKSSPWPFVYSYPLATA